MVVNIHTGILRDGPCLFTKAGERPQPVYWLLYSASPPTSRLVWMLAEKKNGNARQNHKFFLQYL